MPDHVNLLIARISEGNLRRALLSLEALSVQDPAFGTISEDHSILSGRKAKPSELDSVPRPDWEKYAGKTAEKILQDQSPDKLLEVRGMLYELLVHCIPAPLVLSVCGPHGVAVFDSSTADRDLWQTITKRLLERVDESIKADVAYWAAFYEHRLRLGTKPIFHLEGKNPRGGHAASFERFMADGGRLT